MHPGSRRLRERYLCSLHTTEGSIDHSSADVSISDDGSQIASFECMVRGADSGLHFCPSCLAIYRTGPGHCALDGIRLQKADADPLLETQLGDYRVASLIGEGAMARVYKAIHLPSQRLVAIKTLYGDVAASTTMRNRFRREAKLLQRVRHPNVVRSGEVLSMNEHSFLIMDLARAGCLETLMGRYGALTPRLALDVVRGILDGLAALHAEGIIHRDIKPANILIDRTPDAAIVPRIADLGVARDVEDLGASTAAGVVVGSPSFMAPEQARGAACDARSDIYALGVTLHAMLKGETPFVGNANHVLYQKATSTRPLAPIDGLDSKIQDLIDYLTAPQPEHRPESAEEAVKALEDARRREHPAAFPRQVVQLRQPFWPRRWLQASMAAAAVVVGVLIGSSPLGLHLAAQLRGPTAQGPSESDDKSAGMDTPELDDMVASLVPTQVEEFTPTTPHRR